MVSMVRARLLPVLMALAVFGAACGSGAAQEIEAVAASVETTTTISDATTDTTTDAAVGPSSTTTTVALPTTTTVRPPELHETFVATLKPEVELVAAFDEPDGEPVQFEFAVTNPTYFGNELVLMITERTPDGEWLKVQIPVRPNGTEAWIPSDDAVISSHHIRAEINLNNRSVKVWDAEELIAETGAVVGAAASPTPLGRFFVNDIVEKWDGSAYGPYILSLSAFSEAMESFAGGVPVIAIHGTNRPGLIGGAHSNGCIRIPNDVIEFLAATVPMGTPVDITA